MLLSPSRDEFRSLARSANLVPVILDLIADAETPVSVFAKFYDGSPCFLFESAEKSEESGRFSFIGADPLLLFTSRDSTVFINQNGEKTQVAAADPLVALEKAMRGFRFAAPSHIPHFIAGPVGYIGYDAVRFFEPSVPRHVRDDLRLPETMFMIAGTMLVFDHRFRRLRLISNAYIPDGEDGSGVEAAYAAAEDNLARTLDRLNRPAFLHPISAAIPEQIPVVRCNTSRKEFESMVGKARELIAAGDIFQVVLSQRFETDFAGSALDLYRALRFGNPSPYMFCLSFDERFAFLGSSPELHVRSRNGKVEIRPIAGTRPRGTDSVEDERLAGELLADPKERAEHVMLIDLARNDVGRIAQFGSVRVTEQMGIERYSHVMHIVSHVVGQLRENTNAFDLIRATFPAGTVSGAPKIRAMQIIADLEKAARGFYAGVVGYFGFDGSLDSCIALRSVILKEGKAYFQTGAGVVADSDPAREYEECVNKAKAMLEAIGRAQSGGPASQPKTTKPAGLKADLP